MVGSGSGSLLLIRGGKGGTSVVESDIPEGWGYSDLLIVYHIRYSYRSICKTDRFVPANTLATLNNPIHPIHARSTIIIIVIPQDAPQYAVGYLAIAVIHDFQIRVPKSVAF